MRYPLPPGAEAPRINQAINGTGELGQLFASDSLIFGTIYPSTWGAVTNTNVSVFPVNALVNTGSWNFDPAMRTWGAAEFDALTPTPTDAYLASIWT